MVGCRCATPSSPSATSCTPTGGDRPAQRLPGPRRRHRHQHGPHARRGRRRDGGGARASSADVRRHQPRLADGGPRQQRGDPVPDPARDRLDAQGAQPTSTARLRRRARGGVDRRLPGGADPGRGHDPHRRAGERRRGAPAADDGGELAASCGRPATPAGSRWPARPTCCPCSPTPAWSTPAAPASCSCSTPPCTSSTASRCPSHRAAQAGRAPRPPSTNPVDVNEQRYEVMFFCDLADERIEELKQGWGAIGDSIVVVGGDGLWNCHVHTNDIGAAIEAALDLDGRPRQIRVTDLFEEVAAEHAMREAAMAAPLSSCRRHVRGRRRQQRARDQRAVPRARRAGRRHRWADAEPVDGRAAGGRRAGQRRPGRRAARQQEHHPGGRAARRPDPADGARRADPVDAGGPGRADGVRPGGERRGQHGRDAPRRRGDRHRRGHQAVRASQSDAGPIAEGDWMGLVRGDGIVAVAPDVSARPRRCSSASSTTTRARHRHHRRRRRQATTDGARGVAGRQPPGVEVEVHDGGQPLYPYLFGVE